MMLNQQITNDKNNNAEYLEKNKKWCQLKKSEQIRISNILRNQYIEFAIEKSRKPNQAEKEFIVACAYLEIVEDRIYISVGELRKYFQSRISKYDISIEKLQLHL